MTLIKIYKYKFWYKYQAKLSVNVNGMIVAFMVLNECFVISIQKM